MFYGLDYYTNKDITHISTPIKVDILERLLKQYRYDRGKTKYIVNGFRHGFDFGYRGPRDRRDSSENIPLRLGTKVDLWNKVMKEVKLGRYAGPFSQIPYDYYIQSPIGLVPKGKDQTRLIFHLSFDFGKEECQKSFNYWTPDDLCHVKYKDLDYAVRASLNILERENADVIYYSKTDLKSAFRLVPGRIENFCLFLMKLEDPVTGKTVYVVDKNMAFGASISCAIFQDFSDCLTFIIEARTLNQRNITNYLDDFLFAAISALGSNRLLQKFLELCDEIGCPYSPEKTEWATIRIVFLGILLDGRMQILIVPEEKRIKALNILNWVVDRRTITIKTVQRLTGILNFLNKAIVVGRTFTRGLYAKLRMTTSDGRQLKSYHHVNVNTEFRCDCLIWKWFLMDHHNRLMLCRPYVDFSTSDPASTLFFYTDSSASESKGFGCVFNNHYTYGFWGKSFIQDCNPSINYLELFALCIAIFTWQDDKKLCNARVRIFCDNDCAKHMVNNMSSGTKNCLQLLRLLALNNLRFNRRISVRYVKSEDNYLADSLSRGKFKDFWDKAPKNMDRYPTPLPEQLWPIEKVWIRD